MLRWMLWQIEDLAVYVPRPLVRWWYWYRIGRIQ
jgi:hypothetical protein